MPQGQDLPGVSALGLDGSQPPGVPDGHGLLMDLPADAATVRVIAGSGQHQPHRLSVGGAGRAGHHVPQLPVRLGVELVEDHAAGLVAVLGIGLRGEHLHQPHDNPAQAAVLRLHLPPVLDLFLGPDDLQFPAGDHSGRPGGGLQHEHRRPEHNTCVVLVRGADIDLRVQFPVPKQVVDSQSGGQLALTVLFRDLQKEILVSSQKPVRLAVPLHRGIELHQRLPLPPVEVEGLTRVCGRQALHKVADKLPGGLVILDHAPASAASWRFFRS